MTGRLIAYGLLLAALLYGATALDSARQRIGYEKARAEATADALTAEQDARRTEQSLQDKLTKAQNDAITRTKKIQDDAGRARAESDSLRNTLTAANVRLTLAARPALVEYGNTAGDLFAECSRAYQGMAEKADGHASDALMLTEGWPVVRNVPVGAAPQ